MQLVVVSIKTCFLVQTCCCCYYSNGLDDIHFSFSGNPSQYFSKSHLLQGNEKKYFQFVLFEGIRLELDLDHKIEISI